jgi:hypothetical protein
MVFILSASVCWPGIFILISQIGQGSSLVFFNFFGIKILADFKQKFSKISQIYT